MLEQLMNLSPWSISIICYIAVAIITFIPVFVAIIKKVPLNPAGKSFSDSTYFSAENIEVLNQHYTRIYGTLIFWKNKAEWHKRFHYYTLSWTIPISILIPIITQSIDTTIASKLFLTIISSHTALLIAFHRALKIENNFKAYRLGESEFYDTYRRLLDRPKSFGESEQEQINKYFIDVEKIRKSVRNSETDNLPIIDDDK